jgi:hypothetical protein
LSLITLKDGDTINSAYVVKYATLRNGQVKFLLSSGDTQYGETDADIDEALCPIISAAPGFVGVFAYRGSDGAFHYKRRAVIAWRVYPAGNYPLFGGYVGHNEYHEVLIDPAGGIFDCDGNTYATIEDWQKEYEAEAIAHATAVNKAAA